MYEKLTDDQETVTDTAEPIRDTIRPTTQADPATRRTNDPQQKIILCVKHCETQNKKIFLIFHRQHRPHIEKCSGIPIDRAVDCYFSLFRQKPANRCQQQANAGSWRPSEISQNNAK